MIAGKSGNTNEALLPDAEPLVTQEEGNNNMFITMQPQTGYVNVISSDVNFVRTIIPISGGTRQVLIYETVNSNDVLRWKGYVQPQMLSYKLWQGKLKVAIPIECCISALKYKTYQRTEEQQTVAKMIYNVSQDFSNCVFQGTFIGTQTGDAYALYSWLAKKIYVSLFTDNQYTYYDVLAKICTFFGWTCRSVGTTLYFIHNRNIDTNGSRVLYSLSRAQMNMTTPVGAEEEWSEVQFPINAFANKKTELVLFEGVRKATVQCSLESWTSDVEFPDAAIKTAIDNGTLPQPTRVDTTTQGLGTATYYYTQYGDYTVGGWTIHAFNTNILLLKNGSIDVADWQYVFDILWTPRADAYEQDPSFGSQYVVTDYFYGLLTLKDTNVTSYSVPGTLDIQFSNHGGRNSLSFTFKIGDKYYNPSTGEWQTAVPANRCVALDNKITLNIPEAISGQIEIVISTQYSLSGIRMEFKSNEDSIINSEINEIVHSQMSGVGFSEDKEITTDMCLKETYISNSKNILLNNDGTPCDGLVDDANQAAPKFNPLVRLAEEVAREGSRVGEMVKFDIRREFLSDEVTPTTLFMVDELDDMFYPCSISQNWRDDVLKMKLIKRLNQEPPVT